MRIAVVEDDWSDYSDIREMLDAAYVALEIISIGTESAFLKALPVLCASPPDLIILDVMIRFGEDINGEPVGPPFRSGFRLLRRIRQSPSLAGTPVIIHTALDRDDVREELKDLPEQCVFVRKTAPPAELVAKIQALLVASGKTPEHKTVSLGDRITDAFEATPRFGGVGINLKKLLKSNRAKPK